MNTLGLSKCEFEIVERVCLGESKKEVAYNTHRSIHTVETTLRNVYEKLKINKLTDLILAYCGSTFNISYQISEKKRQVFAAVLLLIFSTSIITDSNDLIERREARCRRRIETELFIED